MTTLWPLPCELPVATDHQREKYALASASPVGILGGNPGAGKTHLSAQAIKAAVEQHGLHQVAVAAPTGKAAVRISAAVLSHGLELEATTLHRLLGVGRNGHDKKGWGFVHNASYPLGKRFLFVDESSMADVQITAALVEALQPGTHLMFIGDFAQLPPVGHGAPLRDMIDAGLPYGELTEIHRNDGDVLQACRDMKEGRPFRPSPYVDMAAGKNMCHVEVGHPARALAALATMLQNIPAGIDPVWDVQVLCATNDSTDISRKPLNRVLQGLLNPQGEPLEGGRFRLGDKVICGTNGMLPLVRCPSAVCSDPEGAMTVDERMYVCGACGRALKPSQLIGDFVANGEIGRVVWQDKGVMHVAFDWPKRTIRAAGEWLAEFDLAYAITTHKAQGSQWPVVICMADDSRPADMVCSWEWWRTAASRMEKLCITIGKLATIHRQCRRSSLRPRRTFLAEMLRGAA